MIFTSLGLLLVAAAFLIAGIAKSSVALLMVSLLLTVAAGVVLVLVVSAARRIAAASAPQTAVAPVGAPQIVYVPVQLPLDSAPPGVSNGHHEPAVPIVGYDDMTADQVVALLRTGVLGAEQLEAVRSYEQANQGRRTVLRQLDRALAS